MTGAQFEVSIDGVPRTYRDRKDLALQSAQISKSRNPNSVVRLKDVESGEKIVIIFKAVTAWHNLVENDPKQSLAEPHSRIAASP